MAIALLTIPALAGCDFEAEPTPLSDGSIAELCDRPTQFLADVWHFAEPVVATPNFDDEDHDGKIGPGGGCIFHVDDARVATSGLIRDTPGVGDPPDDAHLIAVGEQVVTTWALGSTTLKFETVMGGWQASMTVTPGADLDTGEPAATDDQITATADELVEIVGEFKGPDFTPTQY